MSGPLKLRAEDAEDLAVISAILQDSLVPVGEMAYLPEEKRFVLMANRFKWEPTPDRKTPDFERTLAGFRVDEVIAVRRRGFRPSDAGQILVLLAAVAEEGAIRLDFAGGESVRLEVGRILCHLDDFGEPWPTSWRPQHPLGEEAV